MTGDADCGRCTDDRCAAHDTLTALVYRLGGVQGIPTDLLRRAVNEELRLVWGPADDTTLVVIARPA